MPERLPVFKEKLKHKGFFNYAELYHFCFGWFKDEKYFPIETAYTEKLTPTGKEILIKWAPYKKISDYYKYVIEVNWVILGMNDAEIEIDGKKQKTNKGEVEMTTSGYIEKDYEARWETHPYYKFFRGIYDKYIARATYDKYEDKFVEECVDFVEQTKAFLAMEVKK